MGIESLDLLFLSFPWSSSVVCLSGHLRSAAGCSAPGSVAVSVSVSVSVLVCRNIYTDC